MPTTRLANFRQLCLAGIAALVLSSTTQADNWPRFRGDNGSGVSDQKGIPTTFSPGDYEWNIELPGEGHSSPVIYGDRLFVTSAVDQGAVRYLFCLNANTGERIWSTKVGYSRSHKHILGSWASSTPTTDGEKVYVAFADDEHYTLTAWDYDGQLVWRRNLGPFFSQHGQGVSPILFDGMVIVPNDQRGPSSILALDSKTGKTVWSTLRSFREASYATPIIYQKEDQKPQLICASGATGLSSLDPYTGKVNWTTGELPARTVASPVAGEGVVLVTCGGGGVGKLLIAVNPDLNLPEGEPRILYKREKTLPYVPTMMVHEGHAYLWNDNGVVSCIELKTGKNLWTKRVGGGDYYGSTVLIDGKIYIMSEAGKCMVIAASPKYEVLGENDLGDGSHATPAVANGRMYLRTFHRLASLKAEE